MRGSPSGLPRCFCARGCSLPLFLFFSDAKLVSVSALKTLNLD